MAKTKRSRYVCQSCGHVATGWLGKCPSCDSWDTFVEEQAPAPVPSAAGGLRRSAPAATLVPLSEIEDDGMPRFGSGIELFDRVLGGGVVTGSAVLLAGEPGIGKSTLLLAVADALAGAGRRVAYVSAEESPRQLRLRAERLGVAAPDLEVAGETLLESILAATEARRPEVLIVDSVQAVRTGNLESLPGSIGQVRACAEALVSMAKRTGTALFLVGHITKQGHIAGPKSLEHLVDTVLSFEGESSGEHRVLRATKNRFGPTGEVAIFEMHDDGLLPVADPSRVLLARRHGDQAGSAVAGTVHGSRPLLVEVQALVHPSGFPTPRRTALGLDGNRVALLIAVLERFGGLTFAERDVFLNVVGGLGIREPAVDLAVAAALISASTGRSLPSGGAFFGEVGLLGETRPVGQSGARLREIAALGFEEAFVPNGLRVSPPEGLRLVEVGHVRELVARLGGAPQAPLINPDSKEL